jgi:hypothetical protein
MSDARVDQRQCPTRTDGRVALFTHRVTESECQSRQRGMFHRCFTCAYNNTWVARHGLPAVEEVAPSPAEAREAASEGPKASRSAAPQR